ncbi:MAG TPA: hypothetical protein VL172_20925 [Kofleriaceae bacterium]|jgi:hypothetical protein|nr:hypothetical protein [Kofleriaceae bacterium]
MSESKKPRFKVLCPVEKGEKTYWKSMGVGFSNRDGSTNVILDGLPVNGKLQIREWDEEDDKRAEERRNGGGGQSRDALPF